MLPASLVGHWRVRRNAGFLPNFGLSKSMGDDGFGVTRVAGLPLLPFHIRPRPDGSVELRYRWLPVRDELVPVGEAWFGRGLLFGREFCQFRLVRLAPAHG